MNSSETKCNIDNNTEGTKIVPSVVRKCCACNNKTDRSNLIRIMTDYKTGKIIINPDSKQFGKSIYLCKNAACLKLAIKKKRLKHLSENEIESLQNLLNM